MEASKDEIKDESKDSPYYQLLPTLLDEFFRLGVKKTFNTGASVFEKGKQLTEVYIATDNLIEMYVSTGHFGDSKFVGSIPQYGMFGLVESKRNGILPCSGRATRDGEILCISKANFDKIAGNLPSEIHVLTLLNRSPAILNLATWLLENGVVAPRIIDILKKIPLEPKTWQRGDTFSPQEPSLAYIHHGHVQISVQFSNNKRVDINLSDGARFGGKNISPNGRVEFDIDILKSTQIYLIPVTLLRSTVPSDVLEELSVEPWWPNESGDSETKKNVRLSEEDPEPLFAKQLPVSKLYDLGYRFDFFLLETNRKDLSSLVSTLKNVGIFFKISINVNTMNEELQHTTKITLGRIGEVLERHGLITRPYACAPSKLHKMAMPSVVVFKKKPVLLVSADSDSCIIFDNSAGLIELTLNDFAKNWNRQGLLIKHSPVELAFEDARKRNYIYNLMKVGEKCFEHLFEPEQALQRNIVLLGLLAEALTLLIPFSLHRLIDEILIRKDYSFKWVFLTGFILCLTFIAIAEIVRGRISANLVIKTTKAVRTTFFKQITQLQLAFVGENKAAEVMSRMNLLDKVTELTQSLRDEFPVVICSIFLSVSILFLYCWELSALVIVTMLLVGLAKRHSISQKNHVIHGSIDLKREMNGNLIENLNNAITAKSISRADFVARKTFLARLDNNRLQMRLGSISMNADGLLGCALAFCAAMAIILLVYKAEHSALSPGAFLAANLYVAGIWRPIRKLGDLIAEQKFLHIEQDAMAASMKSDNLDYSLATSLSTKSHSVGGKIQLENAGFRYDSSGFLVADLRFTIQPGEVVAIVGTSGSGKSTVGKLVAGLLKPTQGRIYYDDIDSRLLSPTSIRDQIGYLGQKPVIFTGSVLDNIAFGDDSPDLEKAIDICKQIGVHHLIERLPNGYSHYLEPTSIDISVGECTLLCLARLLYNNPKVLVLDEMGSNVDPFSMRPVTDNLDRLMANRTVVVVSQRLSTLKKVDRILVVKNGYIVEDGKHSSLIRNNREYSELFRSQVSY